MFMEIKLEHPENAELPITATPDGIVIEVNLEQPTNEEFPIVVTLFPMFIEIRLLQFAKTPKSDDTPKSLKKPSFLKLLGKVIEVKL